MKYEVINGNVADISELNLGLFDAVLSDPPYGISFMAKGWDHDVPSPDMWRGISSVLKPGASVFAFGGTRKFHRLVCGIEDAGFDIRDVLMWLYGSGFPKNHDIGDGYGTALKPAYEPIAWAMMPRDGSYANNMSVHGVAGLHIDAGRIAASSDDIAKAAVPRPGEWREFVGGFGGGRTDEIHDLSGGRWPANIILDEEAGALLDEQSGVTTSTRSANRNGNDAGSVFAFHRTEDEERGHDDTGGASRFFYCAKASREEREAGLDGFRATNVNDGRDTPIDNAYQRGDTQRRNIHPTVKPVDLCRYLAAMLLPPKRDTPRRILVPFSGSGSEMIGCLLAGWDEVVGVELNPEYVEIAKARLEHWERYRCASSERTEKEKHGQFDLVDWVNGD